MATTEIKKAIAGAIKRYVQRKAHWETALREYREAKECKDNAYTRMEDTKAEIREAISQITSEEYTCTHAGFYCRVRKGYRGKEGVDITPVHEL